MPARLSANRTMWSMAHGRVSPIRGGMRRRKTRRDVVIPRSWRRYSATARPTSATARSRSIHAREYLLDFLRCQQRRHAGLAISTDRWDCHREVSRGFAAQEQEVQQRTQRNGQQP